MGWASGGELAERIWEIIETHDPGGYHQRELARDIWRAFEDHDCDVLFECEGLAIGAGYDFNSADSAYSEEEGTCCKWDCEDFATHYGTIADGAFPVIACDEHADLLDDPEPLPTEE